MCCQPSLPLVWCRTSVVPLCLSREEAKEMWEKREAEWAREQSARDRLMNEVIPAEGLGRLLVPGVGMCASLLTKSALVILSSI